MSAVRCSRPFSMAAGPMFMRRRRRQLAHLRLAVQRALEWICQPLEARQLVSGNSLQSGFVSGNIAIPGEVDRYSFTLDSDAKFYFDARSGSSSINWSLGGPAGTVVSARSFAGSDGLDLSGDPVLNLVSGDYVLTVDALNDVTGDYSFCLADLANATLITPGTAVTQTLSPANETDFYQFLTSPGDRFSFDALNDVTGDYSFCLADLANATLITPNK